MGWFEIISLTIAGFLAGFINTLAGGGSVISLAMLMFLGLPATVANGTNRIAIAIQTLTATASFRHQKVLDTKKGFWLAVPAAIGSLLGAWIAVDINEEIFEKAVAVVMLFMLFAILYNPDKWIKEQKHLIEKKITIWQVLLFFVIGIYGGFIHVGIGYFLLAAIVLSAGYELVKANAIKVLIVLLYTPFTLVVFIFNGSVNWIYGLVMTVGNVLGAFIAARMAVSRGASFVKWVIVAVILVTSAHLFDLIDFSKMMHNLK
jgi:hypothetical protein